MAVTKVKVANGSKSGSGVLGFYMSSWTPTIGNYVIFSICSYDVPIISITQTGVNWTKLRDYVQYGSGPDYHCRMEVWLGEIVGPAPSNWWYVDVGASTTSMAYCACEFAGLKSPPYVGQNYAEGHNYPWSPLVLPYTLTPAYGSIFAFVSAGLDYYAVGNAVNTPSGWSYGGGSISLGTRRKTHRWFHKQYNPITSVNFSGTVSGTTWESVAGILILMEAEVLAPSKATNPDPANGDTTDIPYTQDLSWSDPGTPDPADWFDVYHSDDISEIGVPAGYKGRVYSPTTFLSLPDLVPGVTYFWRVDSENTAGVVVGDTWSFQVEGLPADAQYPSPPDTSTDRPPRYTTLEWSPGDANVDDWDVYFGDSFAAVDAATTSDPEYKGNQAVGLNTYDPGWLDSGVTYYWRIDSNGDGGTNKGDIWSFTTSAEAPLITNMAPPSGTVGKVDAKARFSLRDADTEVDRSKLNVYRGTGPVFYEGGVLPENVEFPTMLFDALYGNPDNPAAVDLDGDYLHIRKNIPGDNQRAVYRMGGLEAPANPDDPIMVEFTVKLNETDLTYDGIYSGVAALLFTNDSGVQIHFVSTGVREIAVMDVTGILTVQATLPFDWDESVGLNSDGSNTFKLLWYPEQDLVRLYVRDPSEDTDQLLFDGTVSQFATVPSYESRELQPWLVFGHGLPVPVSASKWKGVYLHNIVTFPIQNGIIRGEHETTIKTNNQVEYDGVTVPGDAEAAWIAFPESYEPQGGAVRETSNGAVLERTDSTKGLSFYRTEPKIALEPTILDFTVSGVVRDQGSLNIATGMEVYLDDGARAARVCLLQDSAGTQYMGLLLNPSFPDDAASYLSVQQSFSVNRTYRIFFDPDVGVRVFNVYIGEAGLEHEEIISAPYSDLPASSLPGPGIGFGHNAQHGAAKAAMTVRRIRYSTNASYTEWDDFVSPTPSWNKAGPGTVRPGTDSSEENLGSKASIVESAGTVTVSGLTDMSQASVGNWIEILNGDNPGYYKITGFVNNFSVVIDNPSASGADSGNPEIQWKEIIDPSFLVIEDGPGGGQVLIYRLLPGILQSDSGWTLEFHARVKEYQVLEGNAFGLPESTNPIRASSGMVVSVTDGTYSAILYMLDVGPPNGRIIALLPGDLGNFPTNYELLLETMRLIRSEDERVSGLFSPVDWMEFHHYRFEKTVGGKIRLLVDGEVAIELDQFSHAFPEFPYPSMIAFGSSGSDVYTVSEWKFIAYSLSDGFDVSCRPVLDEDELLTRFKHGVNLIVEAEDV